MYHDVPFSDDVFVQQRIGDSHGLESDLLTLSKRFCVFT